MTEQKILIVDDSESIGEILKAGLEANGFTVRYEACSKDIIKVCLEFHPDLVLLDINMPVKDGATVASELLHHPTLRNTPVIFLSSLVTQHESGNLNASRELLLAKPIHVPDLVRKIHEVLQSQAPC